MKIRNAVSDEQQDSIQQIDNRFRSNRMGESETVYMHLYPIRWGLVNQIEESVKW